MHSTPRALLTVLSLFVLSFSSCGGGDLDLVESDLELNIAYAESVSDYSPLGFEVKNRKYLANIYEPLVAFDRSFNLKTALAVSWGRLDSKTWEFKLREGVVFHDGTEMTADDVLRSLDMAREDERSELRSLLSGIVGVEKIDDYRVQIVTGDVDPLLLNKLTNVYVFPEEHENLAQPVGTGPYVLSGGEGNVLNFNRFSSYWGATPYFEDLRLHYIPAPEDRIRALELGVVDVLANVPPQSVQQLEDQGFELLDFPSLEVSYLMLNAETFVSDSFREGIWHGVDDTYAEALGGGFLMEANQFAPSGVIGYDPGAPRREVDLELALDALAKVSFLPELTLDLPYGLESLGELLVEDFEAMGLDLQVNMMHVLDYEEHVLSGESDLYFFGWKYDLADASDFYESVLKTDAEFNGLLYSDSVFDDLLLLAGSEMDAQERSMLLAQAAEHLRQEHVLVPLFESKLLYATASDIKWTPRLDGFILPSEIFENVLE